MRTACLTLCILSVLALLQPAAAQKDAPRIDFVKDIQPLLNAHCVGCHGEAKQKGGLRLDSREKAVRQGAIFPKKAEESPLVHRITSKDDSERMPPTGQRLTEKQVALLRAWIDQGAAWPESAPRDPTKGAHWAYRPLVRPPLPAVQDRSQVVNPIDVFIQARLEARKLTPVAPADRRTLIRRVYFDLIGLPPTPEEVDAFVTDASSDAYERVVDILLSSPHFGERWARHWLDVVHWAETHGHDQDVPRENAWPYRDYLIRSYNADKPYGRFIEEQVAGDVLYPQSADAIPALGLLAAGPWDESSQQSIRDDTIDKKQAQNLDRDDMVTTVLTAFSSTTIHCARCHDHKFDPISQEEYYGLQAVFAGVDRANRPYDADLSIAKRRADLTLRREQIRTTSVEKLLDSEAEVAAWERSRGAERWHVLLPSSVTTANGSTPTTLDDGSVRFGGKHPATDIYTIAASTKLQGVTAVRLEVLTDDSLPHKGPGRQDNGNLHLNEFRVSAKAMDATKGDAQPVALAQAKADFDQEGWDAARAIDGKPATAWGIYPQVGKPHYVVFTFARQVMNTAGTTFTFSLEQMHGGGHLIGRLRLSATTAKNPAVVQPLPPDIAAILDRPRALRSEVQRAALVRHVLLERLAEGTAQLPVQQMVYVGTPDFKPEGNFKPAKGCRPVHLLKRGEINKPDAKAQPGTLSCVPNLDANFKLKSPEDEGARRAALAKWLSDPKNVLTWRSIVNRVWHHHFGRGLCATPGDLGRMGAVPTHPELIDWLAVGLIENGGSLKWLHRQIVTSAAYRRGSQHENANAKADSDNLLLWRMNRTRLDAESVRDGVLCVTGNLDRTMGGPSVKHFKQSKGIHVTPIVDYSAFDLDGPGAHRRSVYRFVFRTLPDPLLETLDCPDASQFTPARASSITPLQALALLNDRFMVRQAELFADRLKREVGDDVEVQARRAYLLALGRTPTVRETELLAAYGRKHRSAAMCRVVLNLNEFAFVD